jgi:predicted GNAT family acetyltransferase
MAMPATPDDIPVSHNEAESRFEALVYGELAVCEYQLNGDRMIFTHTYVPPELRGRKVAQKLVTVALDYAKEKNLKVVPACSYVDAFVARRREYQALLA